MERPSILCDFLSALGVPHTRTYSDSRFDGMTFHSLFGLSKVLEDYGVESEAYSLQNPEDDLTQLTPPFLAGRKDGGFVIVERIGESDVACMTPDGAVSMGTSEFLNAWSGVVLLAFPAQDATEPDYTSHRFVEFAERTKKWVLIASAAFIFVYLFIANGIYSNVSTVLLTLISCAGLFVSYHLLLKTLNIHSETGDSICGVIDRTGCSTVLETSASKFFGLFSWSEVGVAYFSVSLLSLLVFPESMGYLALINACCCPFSFWSIWYQKFRAHTWCTMCLIVQACLWLSLACYICGGWFSMAWPLSMSLFVLAASYVFVLLGLNALTPAFDRNEKDS